MGSFILYGLILIVLAALLLVFSFKKLKGIGRILCIILGYVMLFLSGVAIYLGLFII